jgi:NAD+ kinase
MFSTPLRYDTIDLIEKEVFTMERFTVVTRDDELSLSLGKKIVDELTAKNKIFDNENPDIVISVGGDGTMLHALHQRMHQIENVHFVGIHTGTLGFFTDYEEKEVDQLLEDLIFGQPIIEEVQLLEVRRYNGDRFEALYAINEARVENIIKTQRIEVWVGNEYLETFRGNGLCVSTQIGSTAYNRSLRGAVLLPSIRAMQLTEVAGIHHKLSRSLSTSLVIPESHIIRFESKSYNDSILCYDHLHVRLDGVDVIEFRLCKKAARFARYRPTSYIKRLNNLY